MIKLNKTILEKALREEENETIDEVMKLKKLEIAEKQNQLLNKLLENREEKK